MADTEQRWSLSHRPDRILLEPADASCRIEPCCGGTDCGVTLAEAQAEIVEHHRREADRFLAMTPAEFLRAMGYHDLA